MSLPDGSIHTICYIIPQENIKDGSFYSNMLSTMEYLKNYTSMRPHFTGVIINGQEGAKRGSWSEKDSNSPVYERAPGAVLRFARTLSKPPRFSLEEYLSYVTIRLCEILINSLKRGEHSDVYNDLVKSCLYIEDVEHSAIPHPHGGVRARFYTLPTNISRIFVDRCFRPSSTSSQGGSRFTLYDLHQEYWNILMRAWCESQLCSERSVENLKFNVESTIAKVINGKDETVHDLIRLYNLVLYSLYIRELSIISPSDAAPTDKKGRTEPVAIAFSFRDVIDSLIKRGAYLSRREKDILSIMLSIYGSYSAIGQYAMIQWYSRIYGAGLSPSTTKAFEIEYLERHVDDILEPYLREESEFGNPWEPTLVRYLHRLDIDTIQLMASIDIYITKVYHNAWIRSGVLTSFIRSLALTIGELSSERTNPRKKMPAWLGEPRAKAENLLVLPIPEPPATLAEPFRGTRAISLIKFPYRMSSGITELITDTLVHLSEKGVSEEQLNRIAAKIRELLINESKQVEKAQVEIYTRFIRDHPELFQGCSKGIVLEVLHPIEEFILLTKGITRKVAEFPSRTGKEFAIEVLMKRLTESRHFIVIPYVIVDGEELYQEAMKIREYFMKKLNDSSKKDKMNGVPSMYEKLRYYAKVISGLADGRFVESLNLERVLMAINDYIEIQEIVGREYAEKNLKCLETLNAISWRVAQER